MRIFLPFQKKNPTFHDLIYTETSCNNKTIHNFSIYTSKSNNCLYTHNIHTCVDICIEITYPHINLISYQNTASRTEWLRWIDVSSLTLRINLDSGILYIVIVYLHNNIIASFLSNQHAEAMNRKAMCWHSCMTSTFQQDLLS